MEVIWSAEALVMYERALEQAESYSARAAERLSLMIIRAAERLEEFPEMGRVIPEFDSQQMREVFVGRYRLWYSVREDSINVVTIWPAALPVEGL